MRRTTILTDPAVMTELEQLAREERRPVAHLVREALESYVTGRRGRRQRELPQFVGRIESRPAAGAEPPGRHDVPGWAEDLSREWSRPSAVTAAGSKRARRRR